MILKGKKITFGMTGSFYAIENIIPQIEILIKEGADIIPIMSFTCYKIKKQSSDFIERIQNITQKKIIHTIKEAESIGGKEIPDIMIIAPCTGNTIAKLANGIIDTPILVGAKTHLKNDKNIIIGIATSEGLGLEAENIGKLLNMKKIYFIPFRQDNPITKPNSLMYSNKHILETTVKAMQGEQIQPIIL